MLVFWHSPEFDREVNETEIPLPARSTPDHVTEEVCDV